MTHCTLDFKSAGSRNKNSLPLQSGKPYSVGSGDDNTLTLNGAGIEMQHAVLKLDGHSLTIEPVNESPIVVNGEPIGQAQPLSDGDFIILGRSLFTVGVTFAGNNDKAAPPPEPHHPADDVGNVIIIGRMPNCDLPIESPIVSAQHARITWEDGIWQIEDLGSTNGTFVNGDRIKRKTPLQPNDRVNIASFVFVYTGEEFRPDNLTGQVKIEVHDLIKEVKDRSSGGTKRLLDRINLVIEPGEFVAIFGTSGSGKSTLLDALNGRRPATEGQVLFNGTNLYQSFEQFRSVIGYVPQQDIVHRKIKVKKALGYTARLRLPPDTSTSEINHNSERVLNQVKLSDKADLAIDTPVPLSGGQLKRVSLAVELVASPTVLFLDEVTSGLDAGTDQDMMALFRELAEDQKTVICVTHTLESIDQCHKVILLHQGRVIYFGPPDEAAAYFDIERLSHVYKLLESSPPGQWADKFLQSDYYQNYVLNRFSNADQKGHSSAVAAPSIKRQKPCWFSFSQTMTLMRRYLDLIFSDQRNLAIQILQAPLIGAIIGFVFDIDSESPIIKQAGTENMLSFMLVLTAIWFGCLNSAREVVKELPIYLRERSVNLAIAPYIFSKLIPLTLLCLIQCLLLLAVVVSLTGLSGDFLQQLLVIFFAGVAATMMGLTISTLMDSNDKAVAMVPLLLIPQVILSGAVVQLNESSEWVAKLTVIAYWSFDSMKATLSDAIQEAKTPLQQTVVKVHTDFNESLIAVAAMAFALLLIALICMKLKDRQA